MKKLIDSCDASSLFTVIVSFEIPLGNLKGFCCVIFNISYRCSFEILLLGSLDNSYDTSVYVAEILLGDLLGFFGIPQEFSSGYDPGNSL